jgi:hypothetical protein
MTSNIMFALGMCKPTSPTMGVNHANTVCDIIINMTHLERIHMHDIDNTTTHIETTMPHGCACVLALHACCALHYASACLFLLLGGECDVTNIISGISVRYVHHAIITSMTQTLVHAHNTIDTVTHHHTTSTIHSLIGFHFQHRQAVRCA